jgi:electron-transferring-flavoprotein dehydrogenase
MEQSSTRDSMAFDVVIVGGGPAGLASAIRLKQLAAADGRDISVCLIDKGSEIGAHILSGAVMDPRAIDELIPDWKALGAPLNVPVTQDRFYLLSESGAYKIPNVLLPGCFHNHGNYVISLGNLCRWLSEHAESLGVEIYPGFAGSELLFDGNGAVAGVRTGDMGLQRDGRPGPAHQPGIDLFAKYTFFAEGCRGSLGKQLEQRYGLREGRQPQSYGIGIKELWEIPADKHQPGLVVHSAGWPMAQDVYGGGFLYHQENNLVAVGYVVGLNYKNPYLSPFEEFQRYKTHPVIRDFLAGGRRISYGARAMAAGGLQSLPKLAFPGGVVVGDDAGFLNAARIKGSHCAIKSGNLAAQACFAALAEGRQQDELSAYPQAFERSWLHEELYRGRNFKPWMSKGLYGGGLMLWVDQMLLRGKAPWTLGHCAADHEKLLPASACEPIVYPGPDNALSFDRLSSVFISNTNHAEDQLCHLRLRDPALPIMVNFARYDAPEQRYCPAGVYEIVRDPGSNQARLQINAQNCLHCKTCDIKDPTQNIDWAVPQGGDGPGYRGM